MAYKIGIATGNWSAAASWESVANTPTLHASTNVAVDTTKRYSATFTAPNLTDQSTGILLYLNAIGTSGTVTIDLEENSAGWVVQATKTVNIADFVGKSGSWIHIRWTTPYAWASVAADYYRISIVATLPVGTTNLAADSGASLYAFLATYNGTGAAVPAATDDVFIAGNNGVNAITVTVDGSRSIGSGTAAPQSLRSLVNAVNGGADGGLIWDNSASATLTYSGGFVFGSNFVWRMDNGAGGAYPAAFIATLTAGAATSGKIDFWGIPTISLIGQPKTSTSLWRTHPSANWSVGQGVAGNTCIVADAVDWAVNDEVIITPTANKAQTEYKFIKTKTGTSEFTFSDTAGGAESGLTYAHTTAAFVLNITRNVIISSATNYPDLASRTTSNANVNMSWVRFNHIGRVIFNVTATVDPFSLNYSVLNGSQYFDIYNSSSSAQGFTGLITSSRGITNISFSLSNDDIFNKTFNWCFFVHCLEYSSIQGSGLTFNNCYWIACNYNSSISGSLLLSTKNAEFNNCGNVLGSDYDIRPAGAVNTRFTACSFSATNLIYNTGHYYALVLNNTTAGACSMTSAVTGSLLSQHNKNLTTNKHEYYTKTGTAHSSGSGLPKTKVRTVGNLAWCLVPTGTTEYSQELPFYVKASSQAVIYGFMDRDTANSAVTFEIWLPGSTAADATQTFASGLDTDWTAWFVSCAYAGTVPCIATLKIKVTGSATSEIYVADLLNGTNDLGKLLVWEDAKPATIYPELGDPGAVWSYVSEGAETYAEAMKLIRSACAGKSDGHTTTGGTVHYRDAADAKNRITATCDGVGNRSAVTTDGT